MAFYRGGVCTCPECGSHQFDGPEESADDTQITCQACGHTTTVKKALEFGKTASEKN
jgi:translation initiation factor 2 beta subunit (eIF-2beta)/eIF-5